MSLTYRSSVLFSQPSHRTISHMQMEDYLYPYKQKLSINSRSVSRNNGYPTQKLSASQVKTIENLWKKTRTYSLNTLLNNYHKGCDSQEDSILMKKGVAQNNKPFSTLRNVQQTNLNSIICPQKLKLFKSGVNYRSKQRVRGAGVRKVNPNDLKDYFDRSPQQQMDGLQSNKDLDFKMYKTIDLDSRPKTTFSSSFKFNRLQSFKSVN